MNIDENNKIIAEFMGLSIMHNIVYAKETIITHNERMLDHCNISIAKYDSSWDWLIPVVNRIYDNDMYYQYVKETSGQFENKIKIHTLNIKTTYKEVIKFIDWYNKNL